MTRKRRRIKSSVWRGQYPYPLRPWIRQKGWDGWYIVRYGVGETPFKVEDGLKIEPWLAEKFEKIDDLTWKKSLTKRT